MPMREFLSDLRYGTRMLAKRPGTSALAVAALALGIGLTTTMFSIVNAAFLRGLPFEESSRILYVGTINVTERNARPGTSADDYVDWRKAQTSFEDLSAFSQSVANLSNPGDPPERYRGALITPNTLRLLRTAPLIGRDFTDADAAPGAPPVALISHAMWTSRFHQNRDVVGQSVRINGVSTAIIGVMPEKFGFPNTPGVWRPMELTLPVKRGDGDSVEVMGRLRRGVSETAALTEMKGIAAQLEQQYPENKNRSVTLQPFVRRFLPAQIIATLSTMLAAVFGVLLIACVNVTNLQLARAAERIKEVAVRVALGASRWRIVRQLLVEGLLLSSVGAAIGLGIGYVGITLFARSVAETNPPFWMDFRIDGRVLLFVIGLGVVTTVLSSLAPALRVSRQQVNDVLKDEGRASTGLRVGRFSRILVVAELTLSFCLLVVSGLMVKSIIATSTIEFPFATDIFIARMRIDERDYAGDAELRQATERFRASIASMPDVAAAALSTDTPGQAGQWTLTIEGEPVPEVDRDRPMVRRSAITPEYFDVLGVRVVEGRAFKTTDREGSLSVAIVTRDMVRKFFPKGNAIGRRIQLGRDQKAPWWTIVGVLPEMAVTQQPGDVTEFVFVPLAQAPSRDLNILAATRGAPTTATPAIRAAVMQVDPNQPIFNPNSIRTQYDQQTWAFRVFGTLFLAFGLAALLMGAAGLYGVLSFTVRRRTQEIGVRMALGADRRRILRMVMRSGVIQVAIGIILGSGLGGLLGSQLEGLLFRVRPWDLAVFGSTILVLSATGLVASLVPALRAASVDPLKALRHE